MIFKEKSFGGSHGKISDFYLHGITFLLKSHFSEYSSRSAAGDLVELKSASV